MGTASYAGDLENSAIDQRHQTEHVLVTVAELAAEIRRLRRAAELSQPQLGSLVGYTKQYISLAERPRNGVPSRDLVNALDTALNARGALLALHTAAKHEQHALRYRSAKTAPNDARDVGVTTSGHVAYVTTGQADRPRGEAHPISAHIPALRCALDSYDCPVDGPIRPIEQLRPIVFSVVDKRLRSDYADLAREVPALLTELHRAIADCPVAQRPELARLLVQVYRAADAVADKHGYHDLSARIIGLLCAAAVETGDELLQASSFYVRGETFFSSGDLATGRVMLERAANRIRFGNTESAAATYGALHMRAAVMAARAGHAVLAREHIDEAQHVALRVDEGVHLGTAFGAASVRIHRLSLAVELGDLGTALRSAAGWQPPISLPAERRSHFYVDLGRAYHAADQPDRALHALNTAKSVAPEHIRFHPHVKEIIQQMNITGPKAYNPALDALQQAMS